MTERVTVPRTALIPDRGRRTIHLGVFERYVMSGIVGVVFGWIAVYSYVTGEPLVGAVYAIIGGVTVWLVSFRLAVRIEPTTLTIRNPLHTHVVEIADVLVPIDWPRSYWLGRESCVPEASARSPG